MPIDARIPLNEAAPQVQPISYGQALGEKYTLGNLRMSNERERLLLDEEKEAVKRAESTRRAVSQNAGNPAGMIQAVEAGGDIQTGLKLREHQWKQLEAKTGQRLKELDLDMKRLAAQSQILGPVKDEASFRQAMGSLYSNGLIDDESFIEAVKGGYTPETQAAIEQQVRQGMDYAKQMELQRAEVEAKYKAAEETRKVAEARREAVEHAAKMGGTLVTGQAVEFKRFFLPGYLEEQGIKNPTAKDEKAAYEAFQKIKRSTSAPNMQERLAELYGKGDSLTDEETREKRGIEEAMTLVARTYGPGFKSLTTPEGQPMYYHPALGIMKSAPDGTRPQYTASERNEIATLDEMLTQMAMLRELATNNKGSIGWVQGKMAGARRQIVGDNPEVNDLFRMADNLSDQLLRARSGAQINEQEYKRLRTMVPNPRLAEGKFFSDLDSFEAEVKRILGRRSGKTSMIQNLNSDEESTAGDDSVIKWEIDENGVLGPAK